MAEITIKIPPRFVHWAGWAYTRLKSPVFRNAFAAANALALILVLVPFHPYPISDDLDAGWVYGLNEAVGHGLIFGRDIVFTYGPYAAALTGQYHPSTDRMMILAAFLVALATAAGLIALGRRGRWWLLPLVPIAIALSGLKDGYFLVIPLLLLALAARMTMPARDPARLANTGALRGALALQVLALAMLPLIKCSVLPGALISGSLAFILIFRRRPRMAVAGMALFFASLIIFWCAAGQPLWALPGYFAAQAPVVTGYTTAMANPGPPKEILMYLAGALGVLALSYRAASGRLLGRLLVHLGAAAVLFLSFKAGFVRHDGHAMVAAGAFLFTGTILALSLRLKPALAVAALSVLVWTGIMRDYRSGSPLTLQRLTGSFEQPLRGLLTRLSGGDFRAAHNANIARIRQLAPLAPQQGTADIYSFDQSVILANGLNWNPRPVFQSYAAYGAVLARLNAAHLTGARAPDHVYFRLQTIDQRFPSLDDGASWLPLLSRYHFRAMEGSYAHFERSAGVAPPPLGAALLDKEMRWDEKIAVPADAGPVWAEIDVKPSLAGALRGVLYKPPQLRIVLELADGTMVDYRYIDTMGQSGFLLSPVLADTRDVLALLSPRQRELLSHGTVRSFQIALPRHGSLLWTGHYHVRLRSVRFPEQPEVDPEIISSPAEDLSSQIGSAAIAGDCVVDSLNGQRVHQDVTPVSSFVNVEGWALISKSDGIASDEAFVILTAADGTMRAVKARRFMRGDVNAYFGHPEMGAVGYSAIIDASMLHGPIALRLAQMRGGVVTLCPTIVKLSR